MWWRTQFSIYLPFHLFLIMAGMAFFLLDEDRAPAPVFNTELHALSYARQTPQGQQLQLDARYAEQRSGGAIHIQDLDLAVEIDAFRRANFTGARGIIPNHFNAITLHEVVGQLAQTVPAQSADVTLETMTYDLASGRIEGRAAHLQNANADTRGDTFLLDGDTIMLSGNIRATYHPAAQASNL